MTTTAGVKISDADVRAYIATRMPATAAAALQVFDVVAGLQPSFHPVSQIDIGAGTGGAAWAATAEWPSLKSTTLLERNQSMIRMGQTLQASHPRTDLVWEWREQDLSRPAKPAQDDVGMSADLVTFNYVLNEVAPEEAIAIVKAAWARTLGALVIVEPGTPRTFPLILRIRDALIGEGAGLLAPCPHVLACPMAERDWCHFSARIARSARHRHAKGASLGYEDEKFSYLVFTRSAPARVKSRVVRHPQRLERRIVFEACTQEDGIQKVIVPKSNPNYKRLKRTRWGGHLDSAPDGEPD